MRRREVLRLGVGAGLLAGMAGVVPRAWAQAASPNSTSLQFDPDAYTELSTTVRTAEGDKVVGYRFYRAIPYVARPVDVTYQCLNVSVPTTIDGRAVDASRAPILFANSVGGYMPSSVADATGIDESPMTGMPGGAGMPQGAPQGGGVQSGGNAMINRGERVSNARLALAAGYVVVEPGARGRTLVNADGVYFGVAPAAIVDLKAAVRYVRANQGRIPGNTYWLISAGTSAGGALSALLGASGGSERYFKPLLELGAADAVDQVFATAAWCPITDLGHADMAYEWNWGSNPLESGQTVDQQLSKELADAFVPYQASLTLEGLGKFGALTADRYGEYLVETYLTPAATAYLSALSDADRAAYLKEHPEIGWENGRATFTWEAFVKHVGTRRKGLPAFDAFDLSAPENNLFGFDKTPARHFTTFSLRHATGDETAELAPDIPDQLLLMNPMPFLLDGNPARSRHWWIRVGTSDTDTALTVAGNLAAVADNLGDTVDAAMYWDAGHGANEDADAFIRWIADVTGYRGP